VKTYSTVPMKLSKKKRREREKLGLKPGEVIKQRGKEMMASNEKLSGKMKGMVATIKKLNLDEIISDIREDRER